MTNRIKTYALVGSLYVISLFWAMFLFGFVPSFFFFLTLALTGFLAKSQSVSGGYKLDYSHSPGLYNLTRNLSRKAGLSQVPELRLISTETINAAATYSARHPVLLVTEGLLSKLDTRKVRAVFAHEIAHLKNHDLLLLRLGSLAMSATFLFSAISIFVSMTFFDFNSEILLVILAALSPLASRYLLAELSRTREFAADFESARLTGDPLALAEALYDIAYRPHTWWELLFGRRVAVKTESDAFRSHPATDERIRRLKSLAQKDTPQQLPYHAAML